MESVPENRRKSDENDQREDEIVQELPDERGDICLHTVGKFAVRLFAECFSNRPVQKIIDGGGSQKCDGAAEQNEPRSAEDSVKRAVIACIGGNGAGKEEDHAGQ